MATWLRIRSAPLLAWTSTILPSRNSSSRSRTSVTLIWRGRVDRSWPSARRRSGDVKTSSVGRFGTCLWPKTVWKLPEAHRPAGYGARAISRVRGAFSTCPHTTTSCPGCTSTPTRIASSAIRVRRSAGSFTGGPHRTIGRWRHRGGGSLGGGERTTRQRADRRPFEIVAVAASAGGLTALSTVLGGLPRTFGATIVAVQHLDPRHRSLMAEIIGRRSFLPVHQAVAGSHVQRGHVYLAPPDHHLLINRDGTVTLTHTELVNFVRPSADLLFASVAASFRGRASAA